MRFNELAIENAILETETIRSLRTATGKQQLDEVAPILIAGAAWALNLAVTMGITWITERSLNALVNNWRESNFRPDPRFIPDNTRVVIEDTQSGQRLNFRYDKTRGWERQILERDRRGRVTAVDRYVSVSPDEMQPILEKAGRQRRGWFSRLFGRRRLNGLGYNFNGVSEQDWNRAVALTGFAGRIPGRDSNTIARINTEYERMALENPNAAETARNRVLAKAETRWPRLLFGPAGILNSLVSLVGLWYLVNELHEMYKIRLEDGQISLQEYNELLDDLKDATKTIIATAILTASSVVLTGIASAIVLRFSGVAARFFAGALRVPSLIVMPIISSVIVTVVVNEEAKQILIDWLSDIYFLPNDSTIDNYITQNLDRFLQALGITDAIQDSLEVRDTQATDFEPSETPTQTNDPNRWFAD